MWIYIFDMQGSKYVRLLPTVVTCSVNRRFHLVRRFQSKFLCDSTHEIDGARCTVASSHFTVNDVFSKQQKSRCRHGQSSSRTILCEGTGQKATNKAAKNDFTDSDCILPVVYVHRKSDLIYHTGAIPAMELYLPSVYRKTESNSLMEPPGSDKLKDAAQKLTDLTQWLHVQEIVNSAGKLRHACSDDIIIRHHPRDCFYGEQSIISRQNYPVTFLDSNLFKVSPVTCWDVWTDHELKTSSCNMDRKRPILAADGVKLQAQPADEDNNNLGKPSKEQLAIMYHKLCDEMPKFYIKPHDFSIYSDNVEFNNQFLGLKTHGRMTYEGLVKTLKFTSLLYFMDAELEVLKITVHPEESSIQARWRIKALPFHTWLLKLHKRDKNPYYRYYDAYSTFYIGTDGLIHVHKIDKVMPDSDAKKEPNWLTRLTLALRGSRPAYGLPQ
ncbi:uncharacterized protein [Ptychodera flava]|uniref:uncharacterized protein n=1 Tax=Ptychodera flava TaxID=63121 RepID=UPI003969C56F